MTTLVTELKTESTSRACPSSAKFPPQVVLENMYKEWLADDDGIHETFFNWSPLYQEKVNRLTNAGHFTAFKKLVFGLDEDRICKKKLPRTSSDLSHNSLCPWYTVLTAATDRYPMFVTEAVCKCRNCYKSNGIRPGRRKSVGGPMCKEIRQLFKVLTLEREPDGRSLCSNNSDVYSFQKTYQEIATGCTCSFESIAQAKRTVTEG